MKKIRISLFILSFILISIYFLGDDIAYIFLTKEYQVPKGSGVESKNIVVENKKSKMVKIQKDEKEEIKPYSIENIIKNKDKFKYAVSKGRIIIPKVDIDLKIYNEFSNINLLLGACEVNSRDDIKAGEIGNYVLAGHNTRMLNETMFRRIDELLEDDKIYITDEKNIYVYSVLFTEIVNEENPKRINEEFDKEMITLYTCTTDALKEDNRTIVRGKLIDVVSIDMLDSIVSE